VLRISICWCRQIPANRKIKQKPKTANFLYFQKTEIKKIAKIKTAIKANLEKEKNEFKKIPPIKKRQK